VTGRALGVAAVAVAIAIGCPGTAEAKFEPPKLEGHIVDTSGKLDATDLQEVDRDLTSFREATGYPIVVFIAGSLEGESIDDVAYAVFNKWEIGDKGKDNGVLLVIAPIERKLRIETGKGVGGAVTDLQSHDILDKMKPYLQKFQLKNAVVLGTNEIKKLLAKESGLMVADPNADVPDLPKAGDLIDKANLLVGAQRELVERDLDAFRKATGDSLGVYVVGPDETDGLDVITKRMFDSWELGAKHNYDAILFVISPTTHSTFLRLGGGVSVGVTATQGQAVDRALHIDTTDDDYLVAMIHTACTELAKVVHRRTKLAPKPVIAPVVAQPAVHGKKGASVGVIIFLCSIGGVVLLILLGAIFSKRFRPYALGSLQAVWVVLQVIGGIASAFSGSKGEKKYKGGGGKSGGGGASSDY